MTRRSAILICAAALAACTHDDRSARSTAAGPDADAARAQAAAPRPAVVLATPGGEVRVEVEVAIRPPARTRGLMYRDYLPADRGMLFVFERDELQSFWMKNTLISLDMIFIRDDLTVAGVIENTRPMTNKAQRIDKPSRYVLEVNAGWARAHGVGAGTKVRFEHMPEW